MKISFLINSLEGGGAERVVQTLSNHWNKEDQFEVIIFVFDSSKRAYFFDEGIKIIRLTISRLIPRQLFLLSLPLMAFEYWIRKRIEGVDHSISFLVRANVLNSFTKLVFGGIAIISERNSSHLQYRRNLMGGGAKKLITYFYRRSDLIICISNGIEKSLQKRFSIPANLTKTIHNPQCLYTDSLAPRAGFRDTDNVHFLTVGRLIEQKSHKEMLSIFARFHSEYSNSQLTIIGEGPLKEQLIELIESLGLTGSVSIIDFQSDIRSHYEGADIFLFTSLFEGFGNVIVEAMSAGLPIISYDCESGPAEILGEGDFGKLVPLGDKDFFFLSMVELLDPQEYTSYSKKSLIRAADFNVDKIGDLYLKEILSVNT